MVGSLDTLRLAALAATCSVLVALPIETFAENLFPDEITSSVWASYGHCSSTDRKFFLFSGGFRGDGILCASTHSSRDGKTFHLFLECSVDGKLATYMGTAMYSGWYIAMDMVEYRNASHAPDLYIEIERCEN
jgi:hypothetical protein